MPEADPIQIPFEEEEALKLLLQVKPTEDMPGPGANSTEKKKRGPGRPRKKQTTQGGKARGQKR